MMDSAFPESPLDLEEAAYPCKGCGEVSLVKAVLTRSC